MLQNKPLTQLKIVSNAFVPKGTIICSEEDFLMLKDPEAYKAKQKSDADNMAECIDMLIQKGKDKK